MSTQQVSVQELEKYWQRIETLNKIGDRIDDPITLCRMPPWNNICFELNWKTRLLEDGCFSKKHHGYCGVYRLIGLASEGDLTKPATLNRVCGQDTTGTLYIGEAGFLSDRLNQLRRSLLSNENSHGAIRRLKRNPLLKSGFPSNKLAIALLFTGLKTGMVQNDLIEAYINSFGDTPPLFYKL